MSSLWTPGGERPIRRDPPAGEPSSQPPRERGAPGEPGWGGVGGEGGEPTPEEIRAQMAELQEELARTPAYVVVANHALGLFNLARLHLSLQPPQLEEARLAIDAMAALVEGLGSRLGEDAGTLSDALAQLRIAYVQIHAAQQPGGAGAAGAGGAGGGGGSPDDGGGAGSAAGGATGGGGSEGSSGSE